MPKLGILFDIDELGSTSYGYVAYKIFFDAVDTRQISGCLLSDGDTSETLAGRANQYCIAVESLDCSKIATLKKILSVYDAKGLLPHESRFLDDMRVRQEPLVYSARINLFGELADCQSHADWVLKAWKESRGKLQGLTVTEQLPMSDTSLPTEKLVWVILISEKPIPKESLEGAVMGFVMSAFPEQLEEYDPVTDTLVLRDGFTAIARTYEDVIKPDVRGHFKSCVERVEKGVHELPREDDIQFGAPGWWFQMRLSAILSRKSPEFATSTAYRRRYSVVNGRKLGKILVIGVYSTRHPAEIVPAPQAVSPQPPPEAQPAKKYCIHCGFEMRLEGAFCPRCGKRQVEVV